MASHEEMLRRYERLKQMYFNRNMGKEYDEDGIEIPSVVDRSQILSMFENMGVEIPLSPSDPMRPAPRPTK